MPLPVINIGQMREWEKASWAAGHSEAEVIRRVGLALAQLALRLTRSGDLVLIVAGKGHNGDDARCAREHLADRRVNVLEVTNPAADISRLETSLSLRPALVIDGLFGIGLNRPLDAAWVEFINRLNTARLPVLAVDVPSGLNADTGQPQGAAIKAAMTLTVGAPKAGMLAPAAWPFVGRLELAGEVGLVPCPVTNDLNWTLPHDFAGYPPERPVASHKGDFGHLAIIAGSLGYHGAAVLAARGAQRARPGLISLFTMPSTYAAAAAQLQAVMVHPWAADLDFARKFTAVLIGPGLAGPDVPEELTRAARRLWVKLDIPVIVDASALDWLPFDELPRQVTRLITPHPGEAGRLLKTTSAQVQADRPKALRELAAHLNSWVVLKGHQTLVGGSRTVGRATPAAASADAVYVNCSGNPDLAQGGSGDVLSGYLAGLLAQPGLQRDALKAIRYGVWQHGLTADRLRETRRNWVIENLAEELGAWA